MFNESLVLRVGRCVCEEREQLGLDLKDLGSTFGYYQLA